VVLSTCVCLCPGSPVSVCRENDSLSLFFLTSTAPHSPSAVHPLLLSSPCCLGDYQLCYLSDLAPVVCRLSSSPSCLGDAISALNVLELQSCTSSIDLGVGSLPSPLHHSSNGSPTLFLLVAITPVPFAWLTVVITFLIILIIPSPILCSNGDLGCIHRWVDVLSQTVHDQ